ncbi:hypothetical protein BCD49_22625 [Pseudofrankia sp. EUN1h]|nr:hypothetical protein BCD49_22625 [Pseudofrankia sp. EUN1h]
MSVEVPAGSVESTISKISAAAQELGGYVGESRVSGISSTTDDAHQRATLTVRVPGGSFDRLRAAVRGVGTVSSATTSSKDVTGDYVDLQARLAALTATRATFVSLFDKATTIGDILTVQQQITTVQTQIEQIQGQLTVLTDQSDLATLTIEVVEQGANSTSKNGFVRAFGTAWRSFVYCLQGIVSALGVIVVLLLIAGASYPLVRGYQAIRRRAAARRPGWPDAGAGTWAPLPRYPGPVPTRVGTPAGTAPARTTAAGTTAAGGSTPTGASAPVGASEPAAGLADKPETDKPDTAKPGTVKADAEEPGA